VRARLFEIEHNDVRGYSAAHGIKYRPLPANLMRVRSHYSGSTHLLIDMVSVRPLLNAALLAHGQAWLQV
jgi:hypothetical protein